MTTKAQIIFFIAILFLLLAAATSSGQTISSEAFEVQCKKRHRLTRVRIEKGSESCAVFRIVRKKKSVLFESKESKLDCETPFQKEINGLRKIGYTCD